MPYAPQRPCRYPGCANFCEKNNIYCAEHMDNSSDRIRGGGNERGYDAKWRRARAVFLHTNPLCKTCREEGKLTPATVVDHIIPHRGDTELFWDRNNWQPLCKYHHDKKTGGGL